MKKNGSGKRTPFFVNIGYHGPHKNDVQEIENVEMKEGENDDGPEESEEETVLGAQGTEKTSPEKNLFDQGRQKNKDYHPQGAQGGYNPVGLHLPPPVIKINGFLRVDIKQPRDKQDPHQYEYPQEDRPDNPEKIGNKSVF